MLTKGEGYKALEKFKDAVVKDSVRNLRRKNSTGKLAKSIEGEVEVFENSFSIKFLMEEYGLYQDKGVSGIEKKYNTPYSYTNKMPPARAFDKWVIRKGIAPRDEQGRFINRKSLNYIIARSIYKKGIKPSLFFTKPFEKHFKKLPKDIVEKFALDVEDLIAFSLDEKRLKA